MSKDLHCPYFAAQRCLSCSLLSQPITTHQTLKTERLLKTLKSVIEKDTTIEALFIPELMFSSRSKARLSVSGTIEDPCIGLLDKTFAGIELMNCPLHFPIINEIINELPQIIRSYKLIPYDIRKRDGELKGIIVNASSDATQTMLRFILRSTEALPQLRKAVPELMQKAPSLCVVTANIQPTAHQIPEGTEEHILTETTWIEERYGDLSFRLAPQCFSQVTPSVATALYLYVQSIVAELKPQLVFDVFCGIGGFALFAAKYAGAVVGIEYSKAAIECATAASTKNGISNTSFFAADAEAFLTNYHKTSPSMIICNPPRRGLSEGIIEIFKRLKPQTIVYSSCNPETLARDIDAFKNDYHLVSLAPFDMFPLTEHLEVVARLDKRG